MFNTYFYTNVYADPTSQKLSWKSPPPSPPYTKTLGLVGGVGLSQNNIFADSVGRNRSLCTRPIHRVVPCQLYLSGPRDDQSGSTPEKTEIPSLNHTTDTIHHDFLGFRFFDNKRSTTPGKRSSNKIQARKRQYIQETYRSAVGP